jgi:hypothetical protein
MRRLRVAALMVTVGAVAVVAGFATGHYEPILGGGVLVILGWYMAATSEINRSRSRTKRKPPP